VEMNRICNETLYNDLQTFSFKVKSWD